MTPEAQRDVQRMVNQGRNVFGACMVAAGDAAGMVTGITRRFPLGPIMGIAPFNFPLNLVAHKVAPSMAAGPKFPTARSARPLVWRVSSAGPE